MARWWVKWRRGQFMRSNLGILRCVRAIASSDEHAVTATIATALPAANYISDTIPATDTDSFDGSDGFSYPGSLQPSILAPNRFTFVFADASTVIVPYAVAELHSHESPDGHSDNLLHRIRSGHGG